ncbi:unnamed protein product [Eretmochelys imbricata]
MPPCKPQGSSWTPSTLCISPGEHLTLRCLAPGGEAVSSYQFYNQRGERVYTETTGLSGGPWLVLTAETGKAGAYSCEYWAVRDGRPIYSARSQPLRVPVMDFPLAPSISAISDFPGKSPVTIVCSAPQGHVAKRYQFLRQGNVIVSQLGARLQLRQSDLDATSPYTCSYEVNVSGRMIQSLPSAPLSIHLTGESSFHLHLLGQAMAVQTLACRLEGLWATDRYVCNRLSNLSVELMNPV